jgi:hypothetical protein
MAEGEPTGKEFKEFWYLVEKGGWTDIYDLTEKQEAYIRDLSEEMGFENVAGMAGYLSSHEWNYYDIIKASCRE